MAREKKGYEGYKHAGDTRGEREARAKRNAPKADQMTNEMFASGDTAFRDLCQKSGVNPTARQASKFRNGYGLAARQAGKSNRKDPRA